MKTKVLITGGTGFIGMNFLQAYKSEYNFLVISRQAQKLQSNELVRYIGPDQMAEEISVFSPVIMIHLASESNFMHTAETIPAMVRANLEFPSVVVEHFIRSGGKKILSIGTYWEHKNNSPYTPNSFYAATKKAFEDILDYYIASAEAQVITLKLFDTYGPNDHRKKILRLVYEAAKTNNQIDLSGGEQLINLTHVSDVVSAIRASLNVFRPGHSFYLVKDRKPYPLKSLVIKFCEVNGLNPSINWGKRPYSEGDFFQEITIHSKVPGWSEAVDLDLGFKNLFTE